MKVLIDNQDMMRKFIERIISSKISDGDFKDWLEYLEAYAGWLAEDEDAFKKEPSEVANLTMTVDDEDYYLDVIFDFSDEEIMEVDLYYNSYLM